MPTFFKIMMRKLGTTLLLLIGRLRGRFITVHTRPMYPKPSHYRATETSADARCAIVMQGPLRHEDDFTFETVKLYRHHYPAATIILSTWEGEDVSKFQAFEGKRFVVVKSAKPSFPGPHNINMQIVGTKAGIEEASRLGLAYTLKTRTDQRMHAINALLFMQNLLEQFPVLGTKKQSKRIASINTGTSKVRLYYFSDLFMFGDTHDMHTYWSPDLITDPSVRTPTFLPEGYLVEQFLEKTGRDTKHTMEDYLAFMGERGIIIDNEAVDVYWPKYASIWREYRFRNYFAPTLEVTFKTWLNEAYWPTREAQQLS